MLHLTEEKQVGACCSVWLCDISLSLCVCVCVWLVCVTAHSYKADGERLV